MYDVLDVCRYIINYSNEKNYGISNLKLQKILYFVQAYFLVTDGINNPCFSQSIEAWDFGPVVADAYHEFKQFGNADIPTVSGYIDWNEKNPWGSKWVEFNESVISIRDRRKINDVVDKFSKYSASDLVNLTHKQRPWRETYKKNQNEEITCEKIKEYFDDK